MTPAAEPIEVYAVDNCRPVYRWPWESDWSALPAPARALYDAASARGLSAWLAAADEDHVTVSGSSGALRFVASWHRTPAGSWTTSGALVYGGPERWHQEPETRPAERQPNRVNPMPITGYSATRMVYDSGAYPRQVTVTELRKELASDA